MSHFAKIVDGVVIEVLVAEQEFIDAYDPEGTWIQTSYNTRGGIHYKPNSNEPSEDQSKSLRKNYAGIGYLYDENLDAFIPPKPFESWVLNTETCWWEAPVPPPNDDAVYRWDEETQTWLLA
jgi:hypothetical protein